MTSGRVDLGRARLNHRLDFKLDGSLHSSTAFECLAGADVTGGFGESIVIKDN
jgi:hypothetical protein